MKNKLYIIAIVLLLGNTIYEFIEHQKYINKLEKENIILLDANHYGFRSVINSVVLVTKFKIENKLDSIDNKFVIDSIIVYSDSMVSKLGELK